MHVCDRCNFEEGSDACMMCSFGNPCLDCDDWDVEHQLCLSNGGCGRVHNTNE